MKEFVCDCEAKAHLKGPIKTFQTGSLTGKVKETTTVIIIPSLNTFITLKSLHCVLKSIFKSLKMTQNPKHLLFVYLIFIYESPVLATPSSPLDQTAGCVAMVMDNDHKE